MHMDILHFVCKNGLWHLSTPELIDKFDIYHTPLIIAERGFVEILDELSTGIFNYLILGFHYQPIYPYDVLIIREGASYKCVSLLGQDKDSFVWFPDYVYKAMENNYNSNRIYIEIGAVYLS
ncbi:hypothetical protein [Sediminibacterium sp.]|uniref:hypothetical protein n=1 Tax=Sediminibacterium sp. TaxID=1917865 RepID=UPI0027337F51|nr:hypothetical protein [Sediminibacterium sp.]MDP3565636.1 hypothetical protein [Sediminibacterium sp.]